MKYLTFKNFAHLVMIAFAGASLGNVKAFLESASHSAEVAWALGIALGAALVTVAIMLTHVDRQTDKEAFGWLAVSGVVLGLISGSLQSAEYAKHLHIGWAIVLGFGTPLGGEVMLAFAVSTYGRARERERFRNVSLTVEKAVADRLEDAIGDLNPDVIRKHVERTVNGLARLAVDSVAAQASRYYTVNQPLGNTSGDTEGNADTPDTVQEQRVITPSSDTKPSVSERLQEGRRKKTEHRRGQLIEVIREHGPHTPITDLADLLKVGRKTIYSDLEALESAGTIHRNGNGVEIR